MSWLDLCIALHVSKEKHPVSLQGIDIGSIMIKYIFPFSMFNRLNTHKGIIMNHCIHD